MSKLYFRYGAMNSGKSTALLQVAHNYEERGMNVLLIKPYIDSKGGNKVVSRLGVSREVDFMVREYADMRDVLHMHELCATRTTSCIIVDEAQFLTTDQVDQLFEIAVVEDIPVICYGLRTDFRMDGFEGSQRLLSIAHSLEELKTICECGKKALVSMRKVNGMFVFDGDQVAIDNSDEINYVSMCPKCYFEIKNRAQV